MSIQRIKNVSQTLRKLQPQRRTQMTNRGLPHFAQGKVVKGFGRGSKELGIPTANFDEDVVGNLPEEIEPGVYFGFAQIENGPIYKMVMSVGWNPFYKNTKKSMETYIIHKFDEDFYGKILKVVMLGYLRSEKDFKSVEDLIQAINNDVLEAQTKLDEEQFAKYKCDQFFTS
ncbi:riboflavin kinase [Tribolium castaneum]|uniref:riboflavin kinase n=1 Tax=Tribolium castaneum TaxID=7070 RepID=UPI0030FDFF92